MQISGVDILRGLCVCVVGSAGGSEGGEAGVGGVGGGVHFLSSPSESSISLLFTFTTNVSEHYGVSKRRQMNPIRLPPRWKKKGKKKEKENKGGGSVIYTM